MATKEIAGKMVVLDEEGFLAYPDDWTEDMAP